MTSAALNHKINYDEPAWAQPTIKLYNLILDKCHNTVKSPVAQKVIAVFSAFILLGFQLAEMALSLAIAIPAALITFISALATSDDKAFVFTANLGISSIFRTMSLASRCMGMPF